VDTAGLPASVLSCFGTLHSDSYISIEVRTHGPAPPSPTCLCLLLLYYNLIHLRITI